MKLYYTPGACSMAAHIVAEEEGITLDCVKVDLATHLTEAGEDFRHINPKGYVPALELDDGGILTENVAILLYLAHKKPRAGIAPPMGDPAWFRAVEWLTYVATKCIRGLPPCGPATSRMLHERFWLKSSARNWIFWRPTYGRTLIFCLEAIRWPMPIFLWS